MVKNKFVQFEDWLAEELQDEEFQAEYERLGPGFEVARLRTLRGLTQKELADRVGTHQSSISRLESGEREPSLSFLRRVVEALDGRLEVHITAEGESVTFTATKTLQLFKGLHSVADWTDRQPADVPVGEMVPV